MSGGVRIRPDADVPTRRECECCGYMATTTQPRSVYDERDTIGDGERIIVDLCALCYETLASRYERSGHPSAPELQTICFVGNVILDAIAAQSQRSQ